MDELIGSWWQSRYMGTQLAHIMIQNGINEFLRMFHAYTQSKWFGLYFLFILIKQSKYISGGMARCQYYCVCMQTVAVCCLNFSYFFPVFRPAGHFFIKMYFPAASNDIIAHSAYDAWEFIGSNMGLGFEENVFPGAKTDEEIQNTMDITPFITPCIEFAVAISTCTPFTETIITFRIDKALFIQHSKIPATGPDILTSFQDDGPDTRTY